MGTTQQLIWQERSTASNIPNRLSHLLLLLSLPQWGEPQVLNADLYLSIFGRYDVSFEKMNQEQRSVMFHSPYLNHFAFLFLRFIVFIGLFYCLYKDAGDMLAPVT